MKKITIIMCLLCVAFNVNAQNVVKHEFTPPTMRVDGTALLASEINGYNIYLNGVILNSDKRVPAITHEQTLLSTDTSVVIQVPTGKNFYTITTVDTDGRESTHSREVYFVVTAIPEPPVPSSDVVITININLGK